MRSKVGRGSTAVVAVVGAAASLTSGQSVSPEKHQVVPRAHSQRSFGSLQGAIRSVTTRTVATREGRYGIRGVHGRLTSYGGGVAARFGESGPRFVLGGFGVSLRFVSYGDQLVSPTHVRPVARGDRVWFRRSGVTEWYRNGSTGLEQGFTLASRPPRHPADGLMTVRLRMSGSLKARRSGRDIVFSRNSRGGAALRYGELSARDAAGRVLASRLELRDGSLLLGIDDHGARYPLTIDPLIHQDAKLTATSDEAGAGSFGVSAALSADGNTALIGGYSDNANVGAAWVFTRSGSTWSRQGARADRKRRSRRRSVWAERGLVVRATTRR